jgi:N6-L-threonylcarbamoyladenine synthase
MGPCLARQHRADIAASFQQAVVDVLADRAAHAMEMMHDRFPAANLLVIAGGVASNTSIRTGLAEAARLKGFRLVAPPARLCSDNAVMVAWAGVERLRLGQDDGIEVNARPRWPLEALGAVNG